MTFFDSYGLTLMALSALAAGYMAWGIGANDVANAMGTSVGAKVLTPKQAVLIAAIFEFLGAFFAGASTTETVRKGIVEADAFEAELLVLGMLAALFAAGTWLLVASRRGWPVSTTHSIVGAIFGFGLVTGGASAIEWGTMFQIVLSWVLSPAIAGAIAFILFFSVKKMILETSDPLKLAKRYVPILVFLTGFMLASVTLFKGLKNVGLEIGTGTSIGLSLVIGLCAAIFTIFKAQFQVSKQKRNDRHGSVESIFALLMIVTACSMAFAHGSNDVANAVGPVAAINNTILSGEVASESSLSLWIMLVGSCGIVIGLLTYGRRVMKTIGENLTELTPSRGFAAELAASSTVVLASLLGFPVSTTHTLVGAVIGVGLAGGGISAVNLGLVRTIALSWIVTIPVGGTLAVIFFLVLKWFFPVV